MKEAKEILLPALRQYRHNSADGFLPGYDMGETLIVVDALVAELESLRASAAEKEARIAELESGLDWLVTLKRIKDTEGKTDKYTRNQPKAWANAQRLLSTAPGAKERVARAVLEEAAKDLIHAIKVEHCNNPDFPTPVKNKIIDLIRKRAEGREK